MLQSMFNNGSNVDADTVLKQTAEELNKQLPMTVDKYTRLDTSTALPGGKFKYIYTVFADESFPEAAEFEANLKPKLRQPRWSSGNSLAKFIPLIMNVSDNYIENWVNRMCDSSGRMRGKISYAFALLIWADEVSSKQQIELLQSEHEFIRRDVSWAIFEKMKEGPPLHYLCSKGIFDPSLDVRHYAAYALARAKHISKKEKKSRLSEMLAVETNTCALEKLKEHLGNASL